MLPVFFIVLASVALVAALAALFASLRASLGGGSDDVALGSSGPDRGALEDEKNALLRALKDLEYEHEVGKIDDEDYAKLERAYRARAKEVLGELDRDLRPYLSRAEELAGGVAPLSEVASEAKGPTKKGKKKRKGVDAPAAPAAAAAPAESVAAKTESEAPADPEPNAASGATTDSDAPARTADAPATPARLTCPKCATANDPDAAFCKKCATPLAAPTESAS